MANSILPSESFIDTDERTGLLVPDHDEVNGVFDEAVAADFPKVSVQDGTTFSNVATFLKNKNHTTYNLATLVSNQLNLIYGAGKTIDDIASFFKIRRNASTATRIRVIFTGTSGTVITAGTKVTNDSETYLFETEDTVTVGDNGYAVVYAYCTTKGSIEIPEGFVTKLVTTNDSITEVTNEEGTTGLSLETDDEFRARIQMQRYTGSALLDSIRSGLLSVDGVQSCYCEENDTDRYQPSTLAEIEKSKFKGFAVIPPDSSVQSGASLITIYKKLYFGETTYLSAEDGDAVAYRKQTRLKAEEPSGAGEWSGSVHYQVNTLVSLGSKWYVSNKDIPAPSSGSTNPSPDTASGLKDWVETEIEEVNSARYYTLAYSDDEKDYSLTIYTWSDTSGQWEIEPDVLMLRPHSIFCCVLGGSSANVASMIFRKKSSGSDMCRVYESDSEKGEYDINVDHADSANGCSYDIFFTRPEEKSFSIECYVIRNAFSGTDEELETAIKRAIVSWTKGNVFGVDGLTIGQTIYSYEVGSAISEKIPEIKISSVAVVEILSEITETVQLKAKCTKAEGGTIEKRYAVGTSYDVYNDGSTYCLTYDMYADFSAWSSTATYDKGDLVLQDGKCYRSRENGNTGNNPLSSAVWWEVALSEQYENNHFELETNLISSSSSVPVVTVKDKALLSTNISVGNFCIYNAARSANAWSATTSYAIDDIVSHNSSFWIACATSINQEPSASTSSYWEEVPNVTYSEYLTLARALSECADGKIVTQVKNYSYSDAITVSGSSRTIILDMNGFNITYSGSSASGMTIGSGITVRLFNNKTTLTKTNREIYEGEGVSNNNNGWFSLVSKECTVNGTFETVGSNVKSAQITGSGKLIVTSGYIYLTGEIATTEFTQNGGIVTCTQVKSTTPTVSSGYLISNLTTSEGKIFTNVPTLTGGYIKGNSNIYLSSKTQLSGGVIIDLIGVSFTMKTVKTTTNYTYGWLQRSLAGAGTITVIFDDVIETKTASIGNNINGFRSTTYIPKTELDMSSYYTGCGLLANEEYNVVSPTPTATSANIRGQNLSLYRYGSSKLFSDVQVYTSEDVVPDSASGFYNTYEFEISASVVGAQRYYPENTQTGQSSTPILNTSFLTMTKATNESVLTCSIKRNQFTSESGIEIGSAELSLTRTGNNSNQYSVATDVNDKSYSKELGILPYQIGSISTGDIGVVLENE